MKQKIEEAIARRMEIEEEDNVGIIQWWVKAADLIKKDLDRACNYIINDSSLEELYLLGPCFFNIGSRNPDDYRKLSEALQERYSKITEEDFNNTNFKSDFLQEINFDKFKHDLSYYSWMVRTRFDNSINEFEFESQY